MSTGVKQYNAGLDNSTILARSTPDAVSRPKTGKVGQKALEERARGVVFYSAKEDPTMARKRYTAEEIIGHLRTLEIEMGKAVAVVEACRKHGITEQDAGAVFERGAVLHAQRSADSDRTLADPLQHGSSAQQSRRPTTGSRNPPACELKANIVGRTKTPGWSVEEIASPCTPCLLVVRRNGRRDGHRPTG
jgi:hypothetical protein